MPKMTSQALISLLVMCPLANGQASRLAQSSRQVHIQNEAGSLETFLLANPNASLKRKPLGELLTPEDAKTTFTAIVAQEPLSKKKVRGLQVELIDDDQRALVYIDEEGLQELQASLKSLKKEQRFVAEHLDRYGPADLAKPCSTLAINRSPITGESYGVLTIGFYRHEAGFGVYLYSPPGKGHRSLQLYLPNSDVSQALDFVKVGLVFLQAN